MRPISRGPDPGPFANYRDAADPLVARLGCYCSYCERLIETHLAVEHMRPKILNPALERDWNNFLLACVNCNSTKGDAPIQLADYLWPDADNTLRAFRYRGGIVEIDGALEQNIFPLAQALYLLVGLDKDPGNPHVDRKPSPADRRWKTRQEIWDLAEESKRNLEQADSPQMRAQVALTAKSRGGFAIWFSVFQQDHDMLARLIAAFPGSAADCFDNNCAVVSRPGGRL